MILLTWLLLLLFVVSSTYALFLPSTRRLEKHLSRPYDYVDGNPPFAFRIRKTLTIAKGTTVSLHSSPIEEHDGNESESDPTQLNSPADVNNKGVAVSTSTKTVSSKRKMMGFAIPALGIFLCNPLLSNIDNAFVGKTVGTMGLAALSPATICTDQMLFFFSFLGRDTTGLVSRAYTFDEVTQTGNKKAARDAASPALSAALLVGAMVTGIYAIWTQQMLTALQVAPSLRAPASAYIYWRGAIAWAALSQNVVLNILLATRDAANPLKIVLLAAAVNVVGDYMLCVWPLKMGCAGAAAATAFATLVSSFFMVRTLRYKELLPKISVPTKKQLQELMKFTGPLLVITMIRLLGFINMQTTANRLGVSHMAAYQIAINLMFLFQLFGEPLSQLSQTQLPSLVDSMERQGPLIKATLRSILALTAMTSVLVGGAAGLTLGFGTGMFSSDIAVQTLAKGVAPWLFAAVTAGIFSGASCFNIVFSSHFSAEQLPDSHVYRLYDSLVAVDGAMVASRDFGFIIVLGTFNLVVQRQLLAASWCTSVSAVFATFTLRLVIYALGGFLRGALGFGPLGKALRDVKVDGNDRVENKPLSFASKASN